MERRWNWGAVRWVTYKGLGVNLRCAVALKVINARFIVYRSHRLGAMQF